MINGPRKKREHHCPGCDASVTFAAAEALRYIFLYRPFRCENCNREFETSTLGKLALLAMASMVVVLALNMQKLRELQATVPNLQLYLMAGIIVVTLVFALILSKRRTFVSREAKNGGLYMLHFATLIAMPGSLLLFAYMAERFASQ